MESQAEQTPLQRMIVFWVIWASFLVGACVQYSFLHLRKALPADVSSHWLVALAPIFASMILRWNVLPRVTSADRAMSLMIAGIALAEGAMFVGIFVFPTHQWGLFLAALVGIAQHAPIYIGRLLKTPPAG